MLKSSFSLFSIEQQTYFTCDQNSYRKISYYNSQERVFGEKSAVFTSGNFPLPIFTKLELLHLIKLDFWPSFHTSSS